MSTKIYPHERLEGVLLKNGWRVIEKKKQPESKTGGCFSCGYIVERSDGLHGYLKALDFFSSLADSDDWPRDVAPLINAYNFERDLLYRCKNRHLSHVVTALDDGSITIPGIPPPATVSYIIFELADGDVRSQLELVDRLDISWALRTLHQISVGLEQLHSIDVAHQDLKPSNVVHFANLSMSKLVDLGRAAEKGVMAFQVDGLVGGDKGYAPPELLYDADKYSWDAKKMGCDAYHLGSMISSLYTGVAMTTLIKLRLDQQFHWENWRGPYEVVLPYIRAAFYEAVQYVAGEFPSEFKSELTEALTHLCDPDPLLRGHPNNRQGLFNQYSLVRYISEFDFLAKKAEILFARR